MTCATNLRFFKILSAVKMNANPGPSHSQVDDENVNLITDQDREKYKYLEDFFELKRVTKSKSSKNRNLYFKCKKCGETEHEKSCQEGSLNNLVRHYRTVKHHIYTKEFEKVYNTKPSKRYNFEFLIHANL